MFTVEDFTGIAQIQADSLYAERDKGAKRPKEMVINTELHKQLKLGKTVTLGHVGEIPLVPEKDAVLFMFRGYTDEPFEVIKQLKRPAKPKPFEVHKEVVVQKALAETKPVEAKPVASTKFIPPTKRKKTVR
jgi:hypothetical protein